MKVMWRNDGDFGAECLLGGYIFRIANPYSYTSKSKNTENHIIINIHYAKESVSEREWPLTATMKANPPTRAAKARVENGRKWEQCAHF